MQCIILAGGLGIGSGDRGADGPRAMVGVAGEPLIRHQLRSLHDKGIDDVVICIGYRGLLIEDEVARHSPQGMSVRCISDGQRLRGTAGAIRRAVEHGLTDEQFIVLHGDTYLSLDLADVWKSFDREAYRALMTVWRTGTLDECNVGVSDGRVVVYRKDSHGFNHPTMRHVSDGVSIVRVEALLDLVPPGEPYDLADVYESLAAEGQLQAYEVEERFETIRSGSGRADLHQLLTPEMQR